MWYNLITRNIVIPPIREKDNKSDFVMYNVALYLVFCSNVQLSKPELDTMSALEKRNLFFFCVKVFTFIIIYVNICIYKGGKYGK